MNFSSKDSLRNAGFTGFVTIRELRTSRNGDVPDKRGVYLVLKPKASRVRFLPKKKSDHRPLRDRWVNDALIIYVGKAGGPGKRATLRTRLRQYMRSGQGKNAGHSGGELIWQVRGSGNLQLCWKVTNNSDPRMFEIKLIREFEKRYNKPPFANRIH